MTDATHPDTIDWNAFWRDADADERDGATPATAHVVDLLPAFLSERGAPDSVADVGCGPGPVAFALAERHPETEVFGYDAAGSVVAENRERAASEGVANAAFERGVLPEFDPGRQFDLVVCCHTLCYVADSERALRSLYDAVAPGGTLVLAYTNDLARSHYRAAIQNPPDDDFDPERHEERFSLLLDGESTLSYDAIHDALGTWPRSFWSVVDEPEEPWMWRNHPLVWVPK
ncbi:class I SAM-dependent methyltransferase [Halobacterium litoreum]|uniref:Class I SAM-dependent methyltransferase n=1 Tax=Halobacterium litoreum TaxID=2039234 RepID=A0ABD5NE39_9EURY|nr:class I SAM-dependent methyltransferase [Halobacterium litoreum]UHH13720.1 class I SAM-dependent methyltransferase [Halobacterium litoreum]